MKFIIKSSLLAFLLCSSACNKSDGAQSSSVENSHTCSSLESMTTNARPEITGALSDGVIALKAWRGWAYYSVAKRAEL